MSGSWCLLDDVTDLEEMAAEATEYINGEIDRLIEVLQEKTVGSFYEEKISISAADARLILTIFQAERAFQP